MRFAVSYLPSSPLLDRAMRARKRVHRVDWLVGAMMGAGLGLVILGFGSRIAMRIVARLGGQPGSFSFGGSLAVVSLGSLAGVVAALVFVGLRWVLPRWRLVRGALFWLFLTLITLRGLRPVDGQRIALFFPLIVVYGVALQVLWCRAYLARSQPSHLSGGRAATGLGPSGLSSVPATAA